MAGILCNDGIDALNALLAAAVVSATYKVALYVNNHSPAVGDNLSNYTEASFGGYAQQNMTTPVDGGTTSNINTETFAGVTFTATGSGLPVTVYGYFITNGTVLIGAEIFPVGIVLSTAGQGINIVPSLSYQDRSIA